MGQFLYSVYVHSGPDYPGYAETSLFHGREVPDRVQVRCAAPLTSARTDLCPCMHGCRLTKLDRNASCQTSLMLSRGSLILAKQLEAQSIRPT